MKILFLHGWQSVPGGMKPSFLAQHGHQVFNPALPDEDFERAVQIAQEEFDRHHPDVVVGSSRGGAVAMNLDTDSTPLVLLCPAWKRWGAAKSVKQGTVILHSRADEVIPFAESEELVRSSGLPSSALIEVGTDHRLADPEPLAAMLKACESAANWKVNDSGDKGIIPAKELEYWASLGNVKQILKALERGCDCNEKGDFGYTALHAAAENGHLEVARLLVEHGADCQARLDDGQTPVELAKSGGHVELVRLLCQGLR